MTDQSPSLEHPERLTSIGVVGTPADAQRLTKELARYDRAVQYWDSLHDLLRGTADLPPLLVIALQQPDEIGASEILELISRGPMTRLVVVSSPWCGSMNRTRNAWPLTLVSSWSEVPARLAEELAVITGRRPPRPVTAGREEAMGRRWDIHAAPAMCPGRARILSHDRAVRLWLQDALQSAGIDCSAAMADSPETILILDGDPWSDSTAATLSKWTAARGSDAAIVLTNRDEPGTHPAAGTSRVESKFSPLAGWLPRVFAVLSLFAAVPGCSRTPEHPRPNAAVQRPTWDAQVAAARSGESRKIVAAEPISAREWQDLRQACQSLEVLEVEQCDVPDADLDLSAALPHLRRLTLGAAVGDEGAERLSRFPELAELNLPATKMTDHGLADLCRLPLVQLRLGAPQVTDAGLAALEPLTRLRFLHLINVPVTDAGLPPIERIKTLESFYIDNGRCTDEGLSALLEARPDLHFHRDQLHLPRDPQRHPH